VSQTYVCHFWEWRIRFPNTQLILYVLSNQLTLHIYQTNLFCTLHQTKLLCTFYRKERPECVVLCYLAEAVNGLCTHEKDLFYKFSDQLVAELHGIQVKKP
jgi:hypothetical protein